MSEHFNAIRELLAAAGPTGSPQSAARRSQIALIASALLALLLLAWSTWDQIHSRLEQERALGAQGAGSAAGKLTERLQSIEAQLAGFVNRQQSLLEAVVAAPDAAEQGTKLWSVLRQHFPQAEAALVVDAYGTQVANLGAALSEDEALLSRLFSRDDIPPVRFANRGRALYADFVSVWAGKDKLEPAGRTLLLRLSCAELCSPQAMSAPMGHSLLLTPALSATSSDDARVQDSDGSSVALTQVPLGDTGWVLVDRLDARYRSKIIGACVTSGLLLGLVFLLVVLVLYRWVKSHNRGALKEWIDLREGQQKLQAILSATTDGIILTDQGGRIELFNPVAEMMFGFLSDDVSGTNVFKLLPDFFSSQSALSLLQQQDAAHAPPIVQETRGQRKGGREFPVRLWVSSVRFDEKRRLLIVVQDLTDFERNEQQLVFLEQRDVLTGLLNRREFERRLTALLAGPERYPESRHVVCHIDVDQFKLINDTCGHQAGDELLKQLAILIKAKLNGAELIGRFGGDEFVVLFKNRTLEDVRGICDSLIQTVRNFLFTWRDKSYDVAVSMGLAEYRPESEGPSSAMSKADVACNMAKTHGRDRIHIYHEGDVELVRHHGDMQLVSTISQALNDGGFRLYAQPIIPIAAEGTERQHFEVLLRMVDEDGAVMIPDLFIPAAERYILMPAVDRWVVNRLFSVHAENLRAWHRIEPNSFLFAINLSGTSIADEGFLSYLMRQFTDWGVPHQSICFEITETAAVSDLEHARAFMKELSSKGCSFALDDFGTGLSSYSYLKELPVNYLKIDGSFVHGMSEDKVDRALVGSITQIGHVLGLQIVAEWAEDMNTLSHLRALGVDYAQGFGIGAPVPVEELDLAKTSFALSPNEGMSDDRRSESHRTHRGAARPA